MDANELREKVRLAINQSRIDNDRAADTAAIAIRIVAEACAEAVIVDSRDLVDPWSVECLAEHWAKRIRALIPEEPNND